MSDTKPCPNCNGKGECPTCLGTSDHECYCDECEIYARHGCATCDETGECWVCDGTGQLALTDADREAAWQLKAL